MNAIVCTCQNCKHEFRITREAAQADPNFSYLSERTFSFTECPEAVVQIMVSVAANCDICPLCAERAVKRAALEINLHNMPELVK